MSQKSLVFNTNIPSGVEAKKLGLKKGSYSGVYSPKQKKLVLIHEKDKKLTNIPNVDAEFFMYLRTHLFKNFDEYTKEELLQKAKLKRSSSFGKGIKIKENEVKHHIIPFTLFGKSKILLRAQQLGIVDGNADHSSNLYPVDYAFHNKSHKTYTKFAHFLLDQNWNKIVYNELEDSKEYISIGIIEVRKRMKSELKNMLNKGVASISDF